MILFAVLLTLPVSIASWQGLPESVITVERGRSTTWRQSTAQGLGYPPDFLDSAPVQLTIAGKKALVSTEASFYARDHLGRPTGLSGPWKAMGILPQPQRLDSGVRLSAIMLRPGAAARWILRTPSWKLTQGRLSLNAREVRIANRDLVSCEVLSAGHQSILRVDPNEFLGDADFLKLLIAEEGSAVLAGFSESGETPTKYLWMNEALQAHGPLVRASGLRLQLHQVRAPWPSDEFGLGTGRMLSADGTTYPAPISLQETGAELLELEIPSTAESSLSDMIWAFKGVEHMRQHSGARLANRGMVRWRGVSDDDSIQWGDGEASVEIDLPKELRGESVLVHLELWCVEVQLQEDQLRSLFPALSSGVAILQPGQGAHRVRFRFLLPGSYILSLQYREAGEAERVSRVDSAPFQVRSGVQNLRLQY